MCVKCVKCVIRVCVCVCVFTSEAQIKQGTKIIIATRLNWPHGQKSPNGLRRNNLNENGQNETDHHDIEPENFLSKKFKTKQSPKTLFGPKNGSR